jgi:peptidoglycan/LPS O-acetylase OafA/YrhL
VGSAKPAYPALTGVRALGAIAVFVDHFPPWPSWHVVINVMAFFYALSGFLIVRLYQERAQLTRAWLALYFGNRFARIYPVYFLLLTVAVCLQGGARPRALLTNYTLTHALFYHATLILQPSWSLTVEECFYALAPVFMVVIRRRGFAAAVALAVALSGAALAVSGLDMRFLHTPLFVLSTTFFGHFAEFFAGVYLALYVRRLESTGALPAAGWWRTAAGMAGVAVVGAVMLVIYRQRRLDEPAIILINNFLMPLPIALLYCGLLRERTWVARALSGRFACLLGRSSYSFYLLHVLLIRYVSLPFLAADRSWRPGVVLGTLILTWAAAIVLFGLYEEPLNRAIRRWARRRIAPSPAQADPVTMVKV